MKKSKDTFDELNSRIERRIHEITEIQRLAEERFRQKWVTFKADDQKRWTNYTLTLEEQRNESATPGISGVVAGSPAAEVLREGDLLLAVDGSTVNRFRDVELATRAPRVKVTVLRDGEELTFDLETAALGGGDIDRLLLWAGAVLHAPHRAMAAQRGIPPDGVFVAFFAYGSPATRHKLFAGRRIVEVDGRPDPGPRCIHCCGAGPPRPQFGAPAYRHLERFDGSDHAQARRPLVSSNSTTGAALRMASTSHPSVSSVSSSGTP